VQVLEGAKIVDRTGAVGKLRSVYVRDPDGNLVEYVVLMFYSTRNVH
jgi:catechol 2,3-dioxygenase-like lactoylglutathione lyase family enzyme